LFAPALGPTANGAHFPLARPGVLARWDQDLRQGFLTPAAKDATALSASGQLVTLLHFFR